MGCAVSSMEKEAAERSRKIDRELAMDGEKANREIDVISVNFKSSQYYFQEYHAHCKIILRMVYWNYSTVCPKSIRMINRVFIRDEDPVLA